MDSTFKSITRDRRNDLFSQCRVDMNPAGLPVRTCILTWEVPSGVYALHCLDCTAEGRAAKTHVVPNKFANPLANTFCLPYNIYIYIYIYNHSLLSLSIDRQYSCSACVSVIACSWPLDVSWIRLSALAL